jgi:hypothetical protein
MAQSIFADYGFHVIPRHGFNNLVMHAVPACRINACQCFGTVFPSFGFCTPVLLIPGCHVNRTEPQSVSRAEMTSLDLVRVRRTRCMEDRPINMFILNHLRTCPTMVHACVVPPPLTIHPGACPICLIQHHGQGMVPPPNATCGGWRTCLQ